jgi:protein phosphatase
MNIKIAEVGTIFQKGIRANMEDYIYPGESFTRIDDKLFIVCDGMGGHAAGEVASKLACETLAKHLSPINMEEGIHQQLLSAFEQVQTSFDNHTSENPDTYGMGTTLVLAIFHDKGISVMHCGDSRLYHFRNGEIMWMTSDHSLVNEWVQKGLIKPEEAFGHPRSNVITRAVQGASVQRVNPDLHHIDDITGGDYLLLCTDGVTNSINDNDLCQVFGKNSSTSEKVATIKSLCDKSSKDNYSAFIIKF